MEFQTFEEKFQSIMEKWFTDTSDSIGEFYNKQQQAIDEGIELIFSDLRSSLNPNLTVNKNSSDLEIQSDHETEIVKHQMKQITPSVDLSLSSVHKSTTKGRQEQVPLLESHNLKLHFEEIVQWEGIIWNHNSYLLVYVYDTGQFNPYMDEKLVSPAFANSRTLIEVSGIWLQELDHFSCFVTGAFVIVFLRVYFSWGAEISVVGFDIGNENCVIAVVKQKGIDVLLNDESNRETPGVVCFGEKHRFLGAAGAASATMNPKSTISQVKRLIGRNFSDPDVQDELKMLPFGTSEGQDGGILIDLKYLEESHTFTPVQIMGMLFSHLKEIAEKNLEMPVSDCVIGIPSYFSDLQRRAYLNAAAIAGLKPLRLMHDSTATALSYGIYKTDFPNFGPVFVAFVDIGHCDMQVSIVSFEAGQMRILSHVLFCYFATQFKEQYKIDVYSNIRAESVFVGGLFEGYLDLAFDFP